MKILVVGGGVAGLGLAGFLGDRADITLVDHAPRWGDIGYSVFLWGNGRAMLRRLGLEGQVLDKSYELPWDIFEDSHGNALKKLYLRAFKSSGSPIIVARRDLHQTLVDNLAESVRVRMGATIRSIHQNKHSETVTFSDGSRETFDLVVGADGTHSVVRDLRFGRGYLKKYGWSAYLFWAPEGSKIPKGTIELADAGRVYVMYPLRERATVMLAIADRYDTPDIPALRRQKLRDIFSDFDPSVSRIIDAIPDPAHIFYDRFQKVRMRKWYKNRVVLLGDAQHATSPVLGMGTSMALEDAYVLSDELLKVNDRSEIPTALRRFAKRRSIRVRKYQRTAGVLERGIMVKQPLVSRMRDFLMPMLSEKLFVRPMESIVKDEI